MTFLSNLDAFQWVLIAAGIFLLFPTIKEMFTKKEDVDEPDNPVPDDKPDDLSQDEETLTSLVCKWECLSDACHSAGLHEACKKLDEVFPLFLTVRQEADGH